MTAFAQQSNRVSAFIYAVAGDPAGRQALTALTGFVAAVRGKNPAVPIYLFGEQLPPSRCRRRCSRRSTALSTR